MQSIEGLMTRRSSSPPPPPPAAAAALAPLPDDDDVLEEILLRLPPLPSSLPRASLVSKRWLRLLSDPRFLRRFRAFHRRHPPLLGIFPKHLDSHLDSFRFIPTLDPPDRIPSARLSHTPLPRGEHWNFVGCRHGLALLLSHTRLEFTVWDPVAGDQRRVAVPPELYSEGANIFRNGALLCEDGRVPLEAFKVVLLADDWRSHGDAQAFASMYDCETSAWGNLTSTSIRGPPSPGKPSILVGNSLFWSLLGYENGAILEFNLDRKSLAVIEHPVGAHVTEHSCFQILRMEAGGLGLAILSDANIQLWEKNANSDTEAKWMLRKTIDLDKLLSLISPIETSWHWILGYDEDGHVIFISRANQVFMIQLKSMKFKNLFESNFLTTYHPYTSLYGTGRGIGRGYPGAEALNNT